MNSVKKLFQSMKPIKDDEFRLENLKLNFKRGKMVCIATMVIEVFVLTFYLIYNVNNGTQLSEDPYIRMYSVFILVNTIFLLIFSDFLHKKKIKLKAIYLAYAYIFFIVGWNMGITLLDNSMASYILALMAIGMIAIMNPLKFAIMLTSLQVIFFIAVTNVYPDEALFAAYINSSVAATISLVAGYAMYSYRVESYTSHKEVKRKSVEFEALNKMLNEANKKLEFLSQTDGLTGIFNRRMFDKMADEFFQQCSDAEDIMSVIMIDIDHFKCYNDTYGHLAGDDCLVTIVNRLKTLLPDDCMLARYGGEEFAILIKGYEKKEVSALAHMLREEVMRLNMEHKNSPVEPYVTLSFGVYSGMPTADGTLQEFISRADKALYSAKESGRNVVVIYEKN